MEVFKDCHEWRFDGGELTAKVGKNKVIRSGMYHRLEWPDAGLSGDQDNRTVEGFGYISDEFNRMLYSKAK